jgi:hypothetical protein
VELVCVRHGHLHHELASLYGALANANFNGVVGLERLRQLPRHSVVGHHDLQLIAFLGRDDCKRIAAADRGEVLLGDCSFRFLSDTTLYDPPPSITRKVCII